MANGKKSGKQLDCEIGAFLAKRSPRHHATRPVGAAEWDVAMDALLEHRPEQAAQIVRQIRETHGGYKWPDTSEFNQTMKAVPQHVRDQFFELLEQRSSRQAEYERRESQEAAQRLHEIERAPLADRKEAATDFLAAMRDHPEVIAERVGWLLNGNYGHGQMQKAKRVLTAPWTNRSATLTHMVAAYEWQTPNAMAVAAWKKLTKGQQAKLEKAVQAVIKRAESAESHATIQKRAPLEKGQRVVVFDYLGREIGRGQVYSSDNYPAPNERTTWVKMTRHGETVTEEWPTDRVRPISKHG
jgi:mRNA-degrading endonuclease RelE of RelBE toxin-antitoxin system